MLLGRFVALWLQNPTTCYVLGCHWAACVSQPEAGVDYLRPAREEVNNLMDYR